MRKTIVLIGAGSTVFTPGLLRDFATTTSTDLLDIRLFDINHEAAEIMARVGMRLAEKTNSKMTVKAFPDRREALSGADFVTTTIAVGSAPGWLADLKIPEELGIYQTVADSVGPGGVLRSLRHTPALLEIARDIEQVAPDAIHINYSNPLTTNVRSIRKYTSVQSVGLCHGTVHTKSAICADLGVDPKRVETVFAGINHLCWLLDIKLDGEDLYPKLRSLVKTKGGDINSETNFDEGLHSPVSAKLFETYGLYPAPGDRHVAEFFGNFLRRHSSGDLKWGLQGGLDMTVQYIGEKDVLWDELRAQSEGSAPVDISENQEAERLVTILEALITGKNHMELAVNLPNEGKISNLPFNAVVEVPAWIGAAGINGLSVGALPSAIAAVLTNRANQQELTIEAAYEVSREKALQALVLDPLVGDFDLAVKILDQSIMQDPMHMKGFAS